MCSCVCADVWLTLVHLGLVLGIGVGCVCEDGGRGGGCEGAREGGVSLIPS